MKRKVTIFSLAGLLVLGLSTVFVVKALACDHGCTPGYWKNIRMHGHAWDDAGYHWDWKLGDVFDFIGVPVELQPLAGDTLLQALKYKGGPGLLGGARIMLRHSVAALLNGAHPGVVYWSEGYVLSMVNAVLSEPAIDRDSLLWLAEYWRFYNEEYPCPLGPLGRAGTVTSRIKK